MSADMKKWSQPQLIVLSRGQPEEKVLFVCKTLNQGVGTGPGASHLYCQSFKDDRCGSCGLETNT